LDLHENFIVGVPLEKKVPVKLCKSSRLQIWTGFTLADVCALQVLSFLLEFYLTVGWSLCKLALSDKIVHSWHS